MPLVSHRYQTPSGLLGYTNPKVVPYSEVERYRTAGYEVLEDPDDAREADCLLVEDPTCARRLCPPHRDE